MHGVCEDCMDELTDQEDEYWQLAYFDTILHAICNSSEEEDDEDREDRHRRERAVERGLAEMSNMTIYDDGAW